MGDGIIVTTVPVLIGYIICKAICGKTNCGTANIISGRMTSTPAIGMLIKNINHMNCAAIH